MERVSNEPEGHPRLHQLSNQPRIVLLIIAYSSTCIISHPQQECKRSTDRASAAKKHRFGSQQTSKTKPHRSCSSWYVVFSLTHDMKLFKQARPLDEKCWDNRSCMREHSRSARQKSCAVSCVSLILIRLLKMRTLKRGERDPCQNFGTSFPNRSEEENISDF